MPKSFQRDRFFWVVAVQTAIVNFYLGGFGPAQSLLRADQGTSLTIAGLHGTAMGVASIAAGWANPRIAHRFGRSKASWIGLAIFIAGLTLFVVSPPVFITIPATFITGFGVSVVINTMLTKMSSHYGKSAEVAIPQANGIASVGLKMKMITSQMKGDRKAENSPATFGFHGSVLLLVFQVSLRLRSGLLHYLKSVLDQQQPSRPWQLWHLVPVWE